MARSAPKSNVAAVTAHLTALRREQQLDTHGEALSALALSLAALMDKGQPVMMTASWARELRATLGGLTPKESAGDDDRDAWLDELPAPVRDAENL